MAPGADPGRVSRYCGLGQHERCKGRVYVYPPVDGQTIVPCECPVCRQAGRHPEQWKGRPPADSRRGQGRARRQRPTPTQPDDNDGAPAGELAQRR